MQLTALTAPELAQLETSLVLLDNSLDMLLERGVCTEEEGIDLIQLSEAVNDELARRAQEDAEFHMEVAVARGLYRKVVRPDGEVGYEPTGDNWDD